MGKLFGEKSVEFLPSLKRTTEAIDDLNARPRMLHGEARAVARQAILDGDGARDMFRVPRTGPGLQACALNSDQSRASRRARPQLRFRAKPVGEGLVPAPDTKADCDCRNDN